MDMVGLDIQFDYLDPFLLAQQVIDLLPYILTYLILQDPIAIFWTKDDVVFTLIE